LRHVGEDRNTDDTDLMDMHGFLLLKSINHPANIKWYLLSDFGIRCNASL
jgi:hypothetical protein